MFKSKSYQVLVISGLLLILGGCAGVVLLTTGSGLTLWFVLNDTAARPTAAPPPTQRRLAAALVTSPHTPTLVPTFTTTILPLIETSTPTLTPQPTATASPTPLLTTPTPTLLPPTPTATSIPTQPPLPTPTPLPTDTPVPHFAFTVVENQGFPTGKPDFDVFVAVTNPDNRPLEGYRVIGNHSSGLQVESPVSGGDWTENSGAMHYKGGNMKYHVPDSPGGNWLLQLVDEAGQPVAPPVDLPFDIGNPTWYFLLYQETD